DDPGAGQNVEELPEQIDAPTIAGGAPVRAAGELDAQEGGLCLAAFGVGAEARDGGRESEGGCGEFGLERVGALAGREAGSGHRDRARDAELGAEMNQQVNGQTGGTQEIDPPTPTPVFG